MKAKILAYTLTCFLSLFFLGGCGCSTTKQKEYRIGIDPAWYPLELAGRENNVLGFSTDLLTEIARIEKIQLSKIMVNWDNLLEGLEKAQYEAILSSMQPHLFYQNKYEFSDLYLKTGPVLVVSSDSKIKELSELSGKEVAVQSGSSSVLLIEKYPGIIIRTYDSIPRALDDVASQTIDGAIVNFLEATGYAQDLYQGKIKIVTAPLNDAGLRLITLHGNNSKLIPLFNHAILKLKKSGKYDDLAKKWNLPAA